MSPLRSALADYLQVRRALGYKLRTEERHLDQFIGHLERAGQTTIIADVAVAWATMPETNRAWWSQRLTAIRGFASYLQSIDPSTEVPPPLPGGSCRSTPYLYSDADIAALIKAVETLKSELAIATFQTLIRLLAVTGMRVGEAIAVDRDDLDLPAGLLVIRFGKFGKTRALPLHASTSTALGEYLDRRDHLQPGAGATSLFISTAGTRLIYQNVHVKFFRFVQLAGLRPRSATCRPRIHDLRHSFAVRTILDWYREGADVQARLPLLSTYMGHVNPSDTYWYLSAAPELLALAGERLEHHLGSRP